MSDDDAARYLINAELFDLILTHRTQGLPIDETFVKELRHHHSELSLTKCGTLHSCQTLKAFFNRQMRIKAEAHRHNFEVYQELQRIRLEGLLATVMEIIKDNKYNLYESQNKEDYIPSGYLSHKAFQGYLKESRSLISDLSTLTGSNAPVEKIVGDRIQKEVGSIVHILETSLDPETFNRVTQALATAVGRDINSTPIEAEVIDVE